MEIALSNDVKPQSLRIKNKKEIIEKLEIIMTKYERVLTEETLKDGKTDRAELNKIKTELETYRKDLKKEIMKPYKEFEEDYNEIIALIDRGLNNLDTQVKVFEEKEKQAKLEEIIKYFDEKNVDYKELIDFDKVFNEQWLNKTYSMKKVQMDIDHIFSKTNMDIVTIDGQFKEENIRVQVKDFYYKNIKESTVLSLAIQEGTRLTESIKKITETENLSTKEEVKVTNSVQNVTKIEKNEQLFGRSFKVICDYEKLVQLNDFLVNNNYKFELIEKFEVEE